MSGNWSTGCLCNGLVKNKGMPAWWKFLGVHIDTAYNHCVDVMADQPFWIQVDIVTVHCSTYPAFILKFNLLDRRTCPERILHNARNIPLYSIHWHKHVGIVFYRQPLLLSEPSCIMLSYLLHSKRRLIWGKCALESNVGTCRVQDCIDDHM